MKYTKKSTPFIMLLLMILFTAITDHVVAEVDDNKGFEHADKKAQLVQNQMFYYNSVSQLEN